MSEIKALDKLRNSSHLDDDKWTLETGEIVTVFGSHPNDPNAVNWGEQWRKIADEIEAEIAANYCELPKDADGVPIHVGDEMTCHGSVFKVCAIAPARIHAWATTGLGKPRTTVNYEPGECTHYHPPTVEDVLYTYGQSCIRAYEEAESDDAKREMLASLRKEFEMKLREVLRDE